MSENQGNSLEADTPNLEQLFPEGYPPGFPGSQGKRIMKPEAAEEQPEVTEEVAEEQTAENLAEAQDGAEQEQAENAETSQEVGFGRMKLNEFLDEAGVTMEEFYRDVYVERDGVEVPVSKAWDEFKDLQKANETLLRERHELQEKVKQAAAAIPNQVVSPEAQQLLSQAAMHQEQLNAILRDPKLANDNSATSQKVNLMLMIQNLSAQAKQKQAEHMGKVQQGMQKAIEERDMQTRARIKEWVDPAIRQTEWEAIADMLKAYGIQQTNINVYTPNEREMLRDLMLSKGQQKRVQEGVKRIRKVGKKTLGAGARVSTVKAKPNRAEVAQDIRNTQDPAEKMKKILNMDLG